MKRKMALLVIVSMLFILSACSASEPKGKDDAEQDTSAVIKGNVIETSIDEIKSDGFAEKLVSFGFTEEEAQEARMLLLQCGIPSIEGCEATDPNATIDGLVSFRYKMDDDRTVWFTVENRNIFYVSLNGEDLYDEDKGGLLKSFDDVHIPETSLSEDTKMKLRELTESTLDKYFALDTRYYDAWGFGREDDKYMVQCQVSDGSILTDGWGFSYVWYEMQDSGEFTVTGVKINGQFYEVNN